MSHTEIDTRKDHDRFEAVIGLTLALIAALLAVNELFAGKYGEDEIKATNEKASAYQWYQAKSIKQSIVEGQRDLLQTFLAAGAIAGHHRAEFDAWKGRLDREIEKYQREKREIQLGSTAVGRENWVQEVDGELGKVIGSKQWEKQIEVLSRAGDVFDLGSLYFQLALVLGAICILLKKKSTRRMFYGMMLVLGLLGSVYGVRAFLVIRELPF